MMHKNKKREWKEGNELEIMGYAAFMVLAVVSAFLFFKFTNVGQAILTKIGVAENEYTDELGLEFSSDANYTWFIGNAGALKSVKLDGSIGGNGSAKVYLEYEDKLYLVYDSDTAGIEGLGSVSGAAVVNETENITVVEEPIKKEPIAEKPLQEGITSEPKKITAALKGGGKASTSDILTFEADASFNWDADYSKVCAKWEVDNGEIASAVCYGSEKCCNFIELEPMSEQWDEDFVLSYGRYGASLENSVSAVVIYADYSVEAENAYADIVYSDRVKEEADFYYSTIKFEGVCVETCELPKFNESSYKLIVFVKDAALKIDSVRYVIEEVIEPEKEKAAEEAVIVEKPESKHKVVLGQPVKWRKKVLLDEPGTTVKIPKEATEITVKKIKSGVEEKVEDVKVKTQDLEENLESYNEITGFAVAEEEDVELIIEDTGEIVIEYYTDAPQATETEISPSKKEITISSEVHYEDILAFTELSMEAPAEKVHLYWIKNESRAEVSIEQYDTNGNGLTDYIEWIIPSLSEQKYELIISSAPEVELIYPPDLYTNNTNSTNKALPVQFQCKAQDANRLKNVSLWITNPENLSFSISGTTAVNLTELSPETGMSGLYHLNNDSEHGENNTFVNDFSGSNNGGYLTTFTSSTVMTKNGKIRGGSLFEPLGNYVALPNSSQFVSMARWTIMAWLKPTGAPRPHTNLYSTYAAVADQGGYFGIYRGNSTASGGDRIWCYSWDGNNDYVGINYTNDEWAHIACVLDNGTLYGYKNGALAGAKASGPTQRIDYNISIGYGYGFARSFNGTIDEVAVWNTSLDAAQILEKYILGSDLHLTASFNKTLGKGAYTWNCQASNKDGGFSFGQNRTILISYTPSNNLPTESAIPTDDGIGSENAAAGSSDKPKKPEEWQNEKEESNVAVVSEKEDESKTQEETTIKKSGAKQTEITLDARFPPISWIAIIALAVFLFIFRKSKVKKGNKIIMKKIMMKRRGMR